MVFATVLLAHYVCKSPIYWFLFLAMTTRAACVHVNFVDLMRTLKRGHHGRIGLIYNRYSPTVMLVFRVALDCTRRNGSCQSLLIPSTSFACQSFKAQTLVMIYSFGNAF
ncbi:hypothetical protein BC939DRAFT_72197 [Gamsiella multidivaricata]|uniref:uncharacterized protein n=1 Tax=Gamsiella multidivaricata TaxID=101098 RepID=UPI00221EC0FE|nr:uncharacterized protein BC939DRAFT_72197 [Gamsiella multidivaricata]KAI7828251.1 hypothetical protein BC939DRAFT_72197 [Gamsiella multidivaricata]